ncbi:MAG TPA: 2-oxo acid dehydrogenase subunit E2, partial [Pirellulales bacterium]
MLSVERVDASAGAPDAPHQGTESGPALTATRTTTMREELKVPKAGESITEGVLAKWVKSEGQSVKEGDVICEIETDKATAEVYAPFSGTVVQTLKKAGDKVLVEEVIGYIESGNAPAGGSAPAAPSTSAAPAAQSAPATPTKSEAPAPNPQPSYGGSNGGPATSAPKSAEVAPRAMPAAQRAAHDTGVALDSVKPTGPKGQILKEDVMKAAAAQASSGTAVAAPSAPAKPAAPASVAKPLPPAQSVTSGDRQQEVVPMSPIRKRIAQRLVEAQQTAALLTTFNEIDMSGVNALRAKFKDTFQERYQTKLGFTSFFVKAVIEALKAFPAVNAEIRGDEIIYKNYYD